MFKIKELEREHNRSGFDCGNNALNSYLKNIARQHLKKGIPRTFVIIDNQSPDVILGFYTLAACEIQTDKLPRKYAKKFPSKIPAAKLARLAVSKRRQRQGIGSLMALWYFPWSTFINNIWLLSVLFGRPNLKYLHSKSYYLSKYGAFSTIQPHIS